MSRIEAKTTDGAHRRRRAPGQGSTPATPNRARLELAAQLFGRAQAFDAAEAEACAARPELRYLQDHRGARSIMRDEARRLVASPPRPPAKSPRRKPGLRISAGTRELVEAFAVLEARAAALAKRIDRAYESAERAEVELERILEALEAAADETMDWTSEENGELQEDASSDDDDADICFAESVTRARPGHGIRSTPLRASASQAQALGIGTDGRPDPMLFRMDPEELAAGLARLSFCSQPEGIAPED